MIRLRPATHTSTPKKCHKPNDPYFSITNKKTSQQKSTKPDIQTKSNQNVDQKKTSKMPQFTQPTTLWTILCLITSNNSHLNTYPYLSTYFSYKFILIHLYIYLYVNIPTYLSMSLRNINYHEIFHFSPPNDATRSPDHTILSILWLKTATTLPRLLPPFSHSPEIANSILNHTQRIETSVPDTSWKSTFKLS